MFSPRSEQPSRPRSDETATAADRSTVSPSRGHPRQVYTLPPSSSWLEAASAGLIARGGTDKMPNERTTEDIVREHLKRTATEASRSTSRRQDYLGSSKHLPQPVRPAPGR